MKHNKWLTPLQTIILAVMFTEAVVILIRHGNHLRLWMIDTIADFYTGSDVHGSRCYFDTSW